MIHFEMNILNSLPYEYRMAQSMNKKCKGKLSLRRQGKKEGRKDCLEQQAGRKKISDRSSKTESSLHTGK